MSQAKDGRVHHFVKQDCIKEITTSAGEQFVGNTFYLRMIAFGFY